MVYFDGQRYHIADYKSNFLGADQQSYNYDAIQLNMSHASYWLQAGLYLVALHRYLTVNLLDYDIEEHLGSGELSLFERDEWAAQSRGFKLAC